MGFLFERVEATALRPFFASRRNTEMAHSNTLSRAKAFRGMLFPYKKQRRGLTRTNGMLIAYSF